MLTVAVVLLAALGVLLLVKQAGAAKVNSAEEIAVSEKYPYEAIIKKWAASYSVDPDLVAAVAKVESDFDPDAENTEDPELDYDSSYGLMQVQLAVAQDFGAVKDYRNATAEEIAWLLVPENNVRVGTWNLARWLKKYSLEISLHIENVGESGYFQHGRRNQAHVDKILEAYNEYQNAG